MPPELNSRPLLAPGCRLGENNQQRVLLMPERALRLNGPSLEIVERCDGKHTVQQIIFGFAEDLFQSRAAKGRAGHPWLSHPSAKRARARL